MSNESSELYDSLASSRIEIYRNHCPHEMYAGSSEATHRHQLRADNASGMHGPPLRVAACNFRIRDPVLQALLKCVPTAFAVMVESATAMSPVNLSDSTYQC
jgi:hypothetical protein